MDEGADASFVLSEKVHREGVISMRTPLSTQQEAVAMFDSYCKTVILNCARQYWSREMRQARNELLVPDVESLVIAEWMTYYDPSWEIRVNVNHILGDDENVARLPASIRNGWNLPLLLETAVELARRKAQIDWILAVPQIFQGRVQYLLPIHLTNMEKPDLAMALSINEGYYLGHTCLTLEMAYQNARLLARPTAVWLCQLV